MCWSVVSVSTEMVANKRKVDVWSYFNKKTWEPLEEKSFLFANEYSMSNMQLNCLTGRVILEGPQTKFSLKQQRGISISILFGGIFADFHEAPSSYSDCFQHPHSSRAL